MAAADYMIADMTVYEMLWYFLFYSFCGWVVEVAYHAVTQGKVINRGFLNGPLCPVYGFGMLAVISSSNLAVDRGLITLRASEMDIHSLIILFLGSLVFATLVELLAGWLLDINFHMRWWDYSRKPFNFRGYICLEFSIIWGLSITAVILLVHPMMERGHSFGIPLRIGLPVLAVFYALMSADFCVTVAAVNGLNRRLEELDRIQKNMRSVSDRLSRSIGERTIRTAQRVGEGQVQAALAKAEIRDAVEEYRNERVLKLEAKRRKAVLARRELEQKAVGLRKQLKESRKQQEERRIQLLKELGGGRLFTPGRILRDVPALRHSRYEEVLRQLRERMSGR